ncbi:MAG: hypothetical protein HY820_38015 [Acidobacteria bacterium]|nr:hypothetical protein [Acidobacteriota bacterium]
MQQTTQTPTPQPAARPKPAAPPPEFQEGAIASMDGAGLLRILKAPGSSDFHKAKACMRAGELGVKEAIPVLAAMLSDEKMNGYARYGLEPIADPAVDEALRAALLKLKGNALIGVINSIGKRRDAKAIPALAKMMYGADVDTAKASAAALGAIGGLASEKELRAGLAKTKGGARAAVADACLLCAERLLADGQRAPALALYATLSSADVPKAAKLAAMQGIIREETSLTRPR